MGFMQGLTDVAFGGIKSRLQESEYVREEEELSVALRNNDNPTIRRLTSSDPRHLENAKEWLGFVGERTEQNALETAVKIKTSGGDKIQDLRTLTDRIKFIISQSGNPEDTLYAYTELKNNDNRVPMDNMVARLEAIYGAKKDSRVTEFTDETKYVEMAKEKWRQENPEKVAQGQKTPPKVKMDAVKERRRANSNERFYGRLAENKADQETEQRTKFLGQKGKMLAEIKYTPSLIEAKGEITSVQKVENAQKSMVGQLATYASYFTELDKIGGMVDSRNPWYANIKAAAGNSGLGQWAAKKIGTDAQLIRDKIVAMKPHIINDIRQASEMGVKGMDSEKELEFYLGALAGENYDIDASYAAIYVLAKKLGGLETAKMMEELVDPGFVDYLEREGAKIRRLDLGEDDLPLMTQGVAPPRAIEYLRNNPEFKDQFKQKYGYIPEGI